MRIFGVTGWKNTGKTGLVERLVSDIVGRGFTVSTVKHAHQGFDIDHAGRDSHRHREAGATEVLLSSPTRWALMHELRAAPEPDIGDLLPKLSPVDLVLIEGYKRYGHPKLEAWRAEVAMPPRASSDPTIRALASDSAHDDISLPLFHLDDTRAIADFVLREVGL